MSIALTVIPMSARLYVQPALFVVENSAEASEADWLTNLLAGLFLPAAGATIGLIVAFIGNIAFRAVAIRSRIVKAWVKRTTLPFLVSIAAWGAWLALILKDLWSSVGTAQASEIIDDAAAEAQQMTAYEHLFLIVAIAATTWFVYTWLFVLEDAAKIRAELDGEVSSRFVTQAQVLRRLGQVIIWVVGIAFIIFTFPSARQFMGGLLASAGLVSVIAGLAAQSTLSNVFAGLQLAFTDAIRVGDTVAVGPKDQTGVIEEITLAYVVVRIWDQRRMVIPSSNFTTEIFENWSRKETQQQGTVELRLDWAAPMAQIRQKVASILASTDLWDGRNWGVHITDADKDTILVRIAVSAKNSSDLFELRSMIRERIVHWIMTEEPWVRPAFLIRQQELETVERNLSGEQVARLAAELSDIARDVTIPGVKAPETSPLMDNQDSEISERQQQPERAASEKDRSLTDTQDHAHAARLTASRQKAKKARRRAMADRQRELAEGTPIAGEAEGNPDDLSTRVITIAPSAQTSPANPRPQEGSSHD